MRGQRGADPDLVDAGASVLIRAESSSDGAAAGRWRQRPRLPNWTHPRLARWRRGPTAGWVRPDCGHSGHRLRSGGRGAVQPDLAGGQRLEHQRLLSVQEAILNQLGLHCTAPIKTWPPKSWAIRLIANSIGKPGYHPRPGLAKSAALPTVRIIRAAGWALD
uniref:DUF4158 domain-containing protein n=1 Tax=Macrostomum lignano TaxID=282301 RepID=A0A1I8FMD1_9PLAT